LTTLEYALLGLLDRQPSSGYDVARLFANTPLAHFSSSPGAIYPALRRLDRAGLVVSRLDGATETRPRRVYTLTQSGRTALAAWLRQPVTRQELVRDGRAPILRFSLAEGHLSRAELLDYLESFRREAAAYLEELGPCRAEMANSTPHQRLALDHGIRAYEGQLAWIADAIRTLEQALVSASEPEEEGRRP
jgi:DNA-binding PadR family transcriptional regulator